MNANVIINNRKLYPAKVSNMPTRFSKFVAINGYYYEFFKSSDLSYPLELAFAQIDAVKNYELAFIGDSTNSVIFGIFLKEPSRKTIAIEKSYFEAQLNRYKGIFQKIVIINPTDIFDEQIDLTKYENLDFVALEKLPDLIDPNRKKALVRMYGYSIFLIIMLFVVLNLKLTDKKEEVELVKQQLNTEMNLFNELTVKTKNQIMPYVPNKDVQKQQLNQYLNQIDNGAIK